MKAANNTQPIRLAIVAPTYNEIGNVEKLLTAIQSVSTDHVVDHFSVFIIDDSSPDGTADLVKTLTSKLKKQNFDITLITRKEKDGLGRAYIFGFNKVLAHDKKFDYILQMDADLSHNPAYITSFLHQAREGADFVVASRYINGGGTPDWPWYRQLLSRGGNIYTRLLLGNKISDYTGGYNLYSTTLLREMDINSIHSGGYGFLIDLKYRALQQAKHTAQVPIIFLDRQHGSSKIPKSTIVKNFILVPRIRYGKKNTKKS